MRPVNPPEKMPSFSCYLIARCSRDIGMPSQFLAEELKLLDLLLNLLPCLF